MAVILGIIHGLDYLFASFLLGAAVFERFILPAGGPEARGPVSGWRHQLRLLLAATTLSSFSWMILSAADMTESWHPSELFVAIARTDFGHLWLFRVALLMILVLIASGAPQRAFSRNGLVAGALLVPLVSSLTGHSAAQESERGLRILVDWLHSISVGVWTGGLWALFRWLGLRSSGIAPGTRKLVSRQVVKRFSEFAMGCTAIIAGTGVLMTYWAGVNLLRPWSSGTYGILVLAKLGLFVAALGFASINQFIHLRGAHLKAELEFSRSIRREVGLELLLVIAVLMVAGFLTRTELPLS